MFELIYFIIGCITGVSMGVIGIGAGLITMPLLITKTILFALLLS